MWEGGVHVGGWCSCGRVVFMWEGGVHVGGWCSCGRVVFMWEGGVHVGGWCSCDSAQSITTKGTCQEAKMYSTWRHYYNTRTYMETCQLCMRVFTTQMAQSVSSMDESHVSSTSYMEHIGCDDGKGEHQ